MQKPRRAFRATCFGLVMFGDLLLFHAAFIFSYELLLLLGYKVNIDTYIDVMWHEWLIYPGVLVPTLIFYLAGMYRSWDEYVFAKGVNSIISGVGASLVCLVGVIWSIRGELSFVRLIEENQHQAHLVAEATWGFPVRSMLIVMVVAPAMIWGWRAVANGLERRLIGWSNRPRKVLVVGNMAVADLARLLRSHRPVYHVVGTLAADAGDTGDDPRAPYLGDIDTIGEVLHQKQVDEAYLMGPSLSREQIMDSISACYDAGVRPRLVLGVYEALVSATQTRLQGTLPLYRFQSAGITGWSYVIKRLTDIVISGALLAITIPFVIIPACIAIVIESKGWPVFSQTRVGIHGRHFKLYKLRTMIIDADFRGGPLTEDDDPRITRVGAFLRRTSIDELPQLWNVLMGDMSVVGPRAIVPYVADQFEDWEQTSLVVKPGVTGLAQVSGRDEIGFFEKSLLNLYYVRNHSVWLDMRIIIDTIAVVLSMEGTGGTRGAPKT